MADSIEINITLPKGWSELSQEQLRFMLNVMVEEQQLALVGEYRSQEDFTAQTTARVASRCFFEWSGIPPVCPYGCGWLVVHDGREFEIPIELIAAAADTLSWVGDAPDQPVRLDMVDGAAAANADLSSGFSFDSWLGCENLWQAYQISNDDSYLRQMAAILYSKNDITLTPAETLGIFYWWLAVKTRFSVLFPYFFKPAAGPGDHQLTADEMRKSVDAQIRALTKGDITKEAEILSLDAFRTLTELDALAREYDELNRKYGNKK